MSAIQTMASLNQTAQVAAKIEQLKEAGKLNTPIPNNIVTQPPQGNAPAPAPLQVLTAEPTWKGNKNDPSKESNSALSVDQQINNANAEAAGLIAKATKTEELDWPKAIEHLNRCNVIALQYAGKPDCNPYLWLNENLKPLLAAYNNGNTSKELFDSIMALSVPKNPGSKAKGGYKLVAPSVKTVHVVS